MLFISIEYLFCARYQPRSQAILSMKPLSLRSPVISYLSNPVDMFKPSSTLTSLCHPALQTSKNILLPLSSTTRLSSSSWTPLRFIFSSSTLWSSWSCSQSLFFWMLSLWEEISSTAADSTITWAAFFYPHPRSLLNSTLHPKETDPFRCPIEWQMHH